MESSFNLVSYLIGFLVGWVTGYWARGDIEKQRRENREKESKIGNKSRD